MILGKNLVLAIGGTPLAAAKSCSVEQSQSFLSKASPTAGRWEEVTPERLSWSISADCLLGTTEAYLALDTAWRNGTALTIRYYDSDFGINKTGTAYISNLKLGGSVGSLSKMSVSLRGSGAITAYAGTTIPTILKDTQSNCFLTVDRNTVTWTSENDTKVEMRVLELTERTKVRVTLGDSNLIITTLDSSIEQPFYDGYSFNLSDYNATAQTEAWEEWLNAGQYYFICSYQSQGPAPTVTKLS